MVSGRTGKVNGDMCVHCKEVVCKDEHACFRKYVQKADAAAARARQSLTFVLVAVVPTDDRQACIACSGLRTDRELRAIDDGRVWASFHAGCLGTVRDAARRDEESVPVPATLTTGQAIVLAAARHWYRERHGGNVLTKERTAIELDDAVHQLETGSASTAETGAVEVERLREKLRQVEDECTQAIALKVKEHAITWRVLEQVREVLHIENTNNDVVAMAARLRARCTELEELNRLALKTIEVDHSRIRYLEAVGPAPSAAVAAIVEAVVRADRTGAWEVCPDEGDPTQLCSHEACDVSRALRAWQAMPAAGAGTEGVAKSLQARIRMQRKELAALTRTLVRERQRFGEEDTRLRARCEELEAELASPSWSSERDLCVEELRQRIGGDLIELQRRGEKECPLPQAPTPSPGAAVVKAAVRWVNECALGIRLTEPETRLLMAVHAYQAAQSSGLVTIAAREEVRHDTGEDGEVVVLTDHGSGISLSIGGQKLAGWHYGTNDPDNVADAKRLSQALAAVLRKAIAAHVADRAREARVKALEDAMAVCMQRLKEYPRLKLDAIAAASDCYYRIRSLTKGSSVHG